MISRIHQKLGTAGFIIAIVALVAALGGTAFAAAKLNSTQKKEVEKIAKKYAGAPGAPGATGPAGPAGPAGATGKEGAAGAPGGKGDTGAAGTNGKTVLHGTAAPTSAIGTEGDFYIKTGTEPEMFGPKGASNWPTPGTKLKGTTGFTETLPTKQTETGAWSFGKTSTTPAIVTMSFPIPLAAPLGAGSAHFINVTHKELVEEENPVTEETELKEVTSTKCLGTAAAPTAEPGNFCIYAANLVAAEAGGIVVSPAFLASPGSNSSINGQIPGTTGALAQFSITKPPASGWGTWAVTAP